MRGTKFAELSAFAEVAEQRSFTKAGLRLGLSPATLSKTVRDLEASFGVRLLNRTTRSVAPTAVGERLLEQLAPLLAEFEAVFDSVNAFRDKPAGLLRLTAPPWAATHVIGPLLGRFLFEYPQISVELSVDAGWRDIVRDRFDAGLRSGGRIERDMIAVRISPDIPRVVVATPSYVASHGEPRTLEDLPGHNCIRFRYPRGLWPWVFRVAEKEIEVEVDGSLIVNDADIALRVALEGAGLLFSPLTHVRRHVERGELVVVLEDIPAAPVEGYFLYYSSRRQTPAPLRVFTDFLRANAELRCERSLGASNPERCRPGHCGSP